VNPNVLRDRPKSITEYPQNSAHPLLLTLFYEGAPKLCGKFPPLFRGLRGFTESMAGLASVRLGMNCAIWLVYGTFLARWFEGAVGSSHVMGDRPACKFYV
jgi:hypothetical protein